MTPLRQRDWTPPPVTIAWPPCSCAARRGEIQSACGCVGTIDGPRSRLMGSANGGRHGNQKEEPMQVYRAILIASAAASLIMAGALTARAGEGKTGGDMVNCAGVNACKGQGSCATAENSCAGKNGCKGKGVVEMSAADCAKKGGKVAEKPKK